ncbi:hypothetical protein HHK36_011830 [Tetracentron sinense]|uniref:UDP-N-acetylglucosamine--dolichyl-phosphate N-acetylglucosaminephosphotransferase n=1 Tax=Tetracentron sinense TaxID=13715 RepID=A0A835DHN3_TETSI|nr:hypothetical protein HHK36_011830 [Tetracentron sinense]
MTARKRGSSNGAARPPPKASDETHKKTEQITANSSELSITPSKLGQILKVSAFFFVPYFYLIFYHYQIDEELKRSILINAVLSFAGFFITLFLIPVATKYLLRRDLYGKDINKKGTPQGSIKVPETLGIVVGIVFLVLAILFQSFNFTSDSNWLVEYNAALVSICFMILLGFVDDVLDVPWRVKLLLPSIAALPLLMAYAGHTTIIIPKPLIQYVGIGVLDLGTVNGDVSGVRERRGATNCYGTVNGDVRGLRCGIDEDYLMNSCCSLPAGFKLRGWIYKLYMGLLAVFCTNSINIHAGLNGLEAGQTAVTASAILIHNVMQIGASSDPEYKQAHAFSIYLVQPLLTTSLALLCYNWYPSSVFVGDTYTYFAGMTMAVVGILGHFSETLLIFFLPQVLNFLLSIPQLSGYYVCPRHRLPRFDPQTGLLTGTDDGTLVNLFLRCFGQLSEKSLCLLLLGFQIQTHNISEAIAVAVSLLHVANAAPSSCETRPLQ